MTLEALQGETGGRALSITEGGEACLGHIVTEVILQFFQEQNLTREQLFSAIRVMFFGSFCR